MDEPRFIVIGTDGIERGPVTRKDLLQLLFDKVIHPNALLRITTDGQWRKLDEIVTLGTLATQYEPTPPPIPSAGPPPLPEIACDAPDVIPPSHSGSDDPSEATSSSNTDPASIDEPVVPSTPGTGLSETPKKPTAYVAAGIIFLLLALANGIERMMEPKHTAGGMVPMLIDGAIGMFLLFGSTKTSSGGFLGINNAQSAASLAVFRAWAGIICWPFIMAYLSEPKLSAIQFSLNLVGYWIFSAGILCLLWRNRPEQPGRVWRMAVGIPAVILGFLIQGAGNSELLRGSNAATNKPASTDSGQSGKDTASGLFSDLLPPELFRRSIGFLSLDSPTELVKMDTPTPPDRRIARYQCWANANAENYGLWIGVWDFTRGSFGRPDAALKAYISGLPKNIPSQIWTPDGVEYSAEFNGVSGVAADFVVSQAGEIDGRAQPRAVNGRAASASLFCFGIPSGDPKPQRMVLLMVWAGGPTVEQQSREVKRVLNSIRIIPD